MSARSFTIWFCPATFIGGGLGVSAANWHLPQAEYTADRLESADSQPGCTPHPASARSDAPEQPTDSDHPDHNLLACELLRTSVQLVEPIGLTSTSELPTGLISLRHAQASGEQFCTPPLRGPPVLA